MRTSVMISNVSCPGPIADVLGRRSAEAVVSAVTATRPDTATAGGSAGAPATSC